MVCYFLIFVPLPVILPPLFVLLKHDERGEEDRTKTGKAHAGDAKGRAGGGKFSADDPGQPRSHTHSSLDKPFPGQCLFPHCSR